MLSRSGRGHLLLFHWPELRHVVTMNCKGSWGVLTFSVCSCVPPKNKWGRFCYSGKRENG